MVFFFSSFFYFLFFFRENGFDYILSRHFVHFFFQNHKLRAYLAPSLTISIKASATGCLTSLEAHTVSIASVSCMCIPNLVLCSQHATIPLQSVIHHSSSMGWIGLINISIYRGIMKGYFPYLYGYASTCLPSSTHSLHFLPGVKVLHLFGPLYFLQFYQLKFWLNWQASEKFSFLKIYMQAVQRHI